MFAFAIWDRSERTLFAARDRMGVKPLYYAERDGNFAFASRPSALTTLLGEDLDIDPEALRAYLELGYVPAPLSFHRGIRKLPPAHYLLVDGAGCGGFATGISAASRRSPSWSSRPEGELVEELQALIADAVQIAPDERRAAGRIPVRRRRQRPGGRRHEVGRRRASEGLHHRLQASALQRGPGGRADRRASLGVDHVVETLDVDDLLELLPLYIEQFDEPFADSSAFPTLAVARLARRHVTVALSGDGADELFGGYHYYSLMSRIRPALRWPEPSRRRRPEGLLRMLPGHRGKLLAGALDRGSDGRRSSIICAAAASTSRA